MSKKTKPAAFDKRLPPHAVEMPTRDLHGPPMLLTVRELSRHLRVSRATIRRLVLSGAIPYSRVGRQLRFDLLAVRGVVDKHS